jgi:putative DNA primase/helicase
MLASPIKAFMDDRCDETWRAWCDAVGRKESGTKQTFGRDLRTAVPSLRPTRPRDGDDRHRVYEGIGLKEAGEQ